MSQTTLEERVAWLEKRLDEIVRGQKAEGATPAKDWRRTVGMFRGDPIMREIIDEALRMRDQERREAEEEERGEQP